MVLVLFLFKDYIRWGSEIIKQNCFYLILYFVVSAIFWYPTILLSYYPTILLSYYPTILLSYYPTILRSYDPTILLSYYPTILLSYYSNILISYYPINSPIFLSIPLSYIYYLSKITAKFPCWIDIWSTLQI